MPPPPLSIRTIVSGSSRRRAASRPPMSWASATSPISSTTGPRPSAAAPKALETVPSIPLAPRLHSTRGGSGRTGQKVSMSRTGIEEATNSVACAGSSTPSSAATAGSLRPPAASTPRSPRRRARRRCATRRASRGRRRRARRDRPRARPASARAPARASRRAPPPGPARRPRRRGSPAGCRREPASHSRSGLEVGRSPTRSTRSGRCALGERGVAQQRVVVRDRGIPRRAPGQRVGEQRPAGDSAERRGGRAERRASALVAARDEHAAARAREQRAQLGLAVGAARSRGRSAHVWRARAPARRVCGQLAPVGHQRLAQGEVEVHDPGTSLQRAPVSAARQRAHPAQAAGRGLAQILARRLRPTRARRGRGARLRSGAGYVQIELLDPDVEEPLRGVPEDLDLVDRLPGAALAQLGRTVGAEDQQRHAGLARLDDGRQQLGERGAGGAGHRDRQTRGLGQPKREEARAALVDVRVAAQALLAREAQHERRAARARRGAGVADAAARELVYEGPQQQVGVGRGGDVSVGGSLVAVARLVVCRVGAVGSVVWRRLRR